MTFVTHDVSEMGILSRLETGALGTLSTESFLDGGSRLKFLSAAARGSLADAAHAAGWVAQKSR